MVLSEPLPDDGNFAGVLVDTNHYIAAGVPKGSTIVLDLGANPLLPQRNIAIRARGDDGYKLYKYHSSTQTTVRVQDLASQEQLRSLRLAQISAIHLVYQITMPR